MKKSIFEKNETFNIINILYILFKLRQNGKVQGLSSKCTHYGAPLIKGSIKKLYNFFLVEIFSNS